MILLLTLLAAAVASCIGSCQPGPVNVAVLAATVHHGQRQGLILALGGSLPELLYCAAAFLGVSLLAVPAAWLPWLALLPGLVLMATGFGMRRTLHRLPDPNQLPDRSRSSWQSFWLGVLLGGGNPQLLAFWLLVCAGMRAYLPAVPGQAWAAGVGAMLGAYLLHWLVAKGAQQAGWMQRLQQPLRWAGLVLMLVGGGQALVAAWHLA